MPIYSITILIPYKIETKKKHKIKHQHNIDIKSLKENLKPNEINSPEHSSDKGS